MSKDQSARVLDGLAMANFLAGEPGKAAALQKRALAALGDGEEELAVELQKKLDRYLREAEEGGFEIEE